MSGTFLLKRLSRHRQKGKKGSPLAENSREHSANLQFMKLQRAEDGKKAMSEYETAAAALRAKTARLRALRLARDEEEKTAAATAPTVAKTKPAKKKKAPSSTLSEWLVEQRKDGHKS
jgi:hypothetical protein